MSAATLPPPPPLPLPTIAAASSMLQNGAHAPSVTSKAEATPKNIASTLNGISRAPDLAIVDHTKPMPPTGAATSFATPSASTAGSPIEYSSRFLWKSSKFQLANCLNQRHPQFSTATPRQHRRRRRRLHRLHRLHRRRRRRRHQTRRRSPPTRQITTSPRCQMATSRRRVQSARPRPSQAKFSTTRRRLQTLRPPQQSRRPVTSSLGSPFRRRPS